MTEIYIALGANLPSGNVDPAATLTDALVRLGARPDLTVTACSTWYATPAVPAGSGPEFVNGAARIDTDLTPEAVLEALHEVERALGRTRLDRWAPRVCDLDLIAAAGTILPDRATLAAWMALDPDAARTRAPERLVLPHPRLHERAFVLTPLADIAPDWRHPLTGKSAAQMLAALPLSDREAIRAIPPTG